MNMAHLSRADADGVRAARGRRRCAPPCTTYLIYRGRHRHAADRRRASTRGSPRPRSSATRSGARPSSSTPTSSRRAPRRLPLDARHARASATSTRAASARTWSRTTCSTSCCFSLPDNDTLLAPRGPYAQVTSIAEADRALERIDARRRRRRRVPRGPRRDRDVRPLADRGRGRASTSPRRWPTAACSSPTTPRPTRRSIAVCPSARSAMVYVLDPERARRARCRGVARGPAGEAEGVDLGRRTMAATRRSVGVVARRRAALRARRRAEDLRGGRWSVDGDARHAARSRSRTGASGSRTYPDALGAALVGAPLPAPGDVLVSAAPGYEFVDWGGADHVGGGSHGSLHRGDSLGTLIVRTGPGSASAEPASSGRSRTLPRRSSTTSARYPRDDAGRGRRALRAEPSASHRASGTAYAARTTGSSSSSSAWSAGPATSSTSACSRSASHVLDLHHLAGRDARVRRRGHEQLLVEPPLDVRGARRPRRLPGGALLHRQRRRVPVPGRAARAARRAAGCPRSPRRRSRSSPPRRSTSSGTRCGASARTLAAALAPLLALLALAAGAAAAAAELTTPAVARRSRPEGFELQRARGRPDRRPRRRGARRARERTASCGRTRLHRRRPALAGVAGSRDGKERAQVQIDDRTRRA